MATHKHLRQSLMRIDGKGYPAYKSIKGRYEFEEFTLFIDHVQGDPFAAPSKLRVKVPASVAGIPQALQKNRSRALGVASHLATVFAARAKSYSGHKGSGKSGLLAMDGPGQEVLPTTAVQLWPDGVEARFFAGLPARGRRVLGRRAEDMLLRDLPELVYDSLVYTRLDPKEVEASAKANEDAEAARANLRKALERVQGAGEVIVRVNPSQLAALRETCVLDGDAGAVADGRVRLVGDEGVSRGGVRAACGRGEIDATIERQLDAVAAAVLGRADEERRT